VDHREADLAARLDARLALPAAGAVGRHAGAAARELPALVAGGGVDDDAGARGHGG
jgi:hypothetical protein